MSDTAAVPPPPPPPPGLAANEPVGLGGWLILPIIGLFVTPIRGVTHLLSYDDVLNGMGQLGGGLQAFVLLELIGNVIFLLVLPIFLIVLLFRRTRDFPRWFTIWAAGGLAFIVLDLLVAKVLFDDIFAAMGQGVLNEESGAELIRSLVTAGIWIPYMRMSRRVANTFVN